MSVIKWPDLLKREPDVKCCTTPNQFARAAQISYRRRVEFRIFLSLECDDHNGRFEWKMGKMRKVVAQSLRTKTAGA